MATSTNTDAMHVQNTGQTLELVAATEDEVAAWLSAAEGRAVTVQEVRRIENQALRKLRRALHERGILVSDLLLEG